MQMQTDGSRKYFTVILEEFDSKLSGTFHRPYVRRLYIRKIVKQVQAGINCMYVWLKKDEEEEEMGKGMMFLWCGARYWNLTSSLDCPQGTYNNSSFLLLYIPFSLNQCWKNIFYIFEPFKL